ncbi:MAG TPA: helix-turn-helix domain-containing protein [Thermoanaerobaculia bacterium]|nr:helix-turn-helix domain-containing protein [Thermoanaerobaculia bacterium]
MAIKSTPMGLRAGTADTPNARRPVSPDKEAEEADLSLLTGFAAQVRQAPGEHVDVAALARAAGVSAARLRLLLCRHYHTTPEAFLQRARLDAIRHGLLATSRPIPDLAFAAGWTRLPDFQAAFLKATGLTPEEYRKLPERRGFVLRLPTGYRFADTLRYLGRDPLSLSERVEGRAFAKGVRLDGRPALLTIELTEGATALCQVEIRSGWTPQAAMDAHAAALRLLGLTLDPAPFERRAQKFPGLARLIAPRRGLRLPQTAEPFEGLCWAIVGQQVNLTFAATLRRRVVELAGEPLGAAARGLYAPPTPEAVAGLDPAALSARQFSRRKAEYLLGAAAAIASGELPLQDLEREAATLVERRLTSLRGLGPWTAHYVMLRSLGFADCLPVGDSGLAAGLVRFFNLDHRPAPEETRELLAPFSPFRSFVTAHLWASLGDTP